MRAGPTDAALQNVRYSQIISNLTEISFAAIIHNTRPTDDFQVGDLRQLGQNCILDPIDECRAFLLLALIFKRLKRDFVWFRMTDKFTFPRDPSSSPPQCHSPRFK